MNHVQWAFASYHKSKWRKYSEIHTAQIANKYFKLLSPNFQSDNVLPRIKNAYF